MDKNRHLITKYLEGELDALSATRFEEELKTNAMLRAELELYREVDEALADTEVMDLRMQLDDLRQNHGEEIFAAPGRRMNRRALIAVAATVALLVGFSAVNLLWFKSGQKIADSYFQPYEITSTNRSAPTDADRTLRVAMEKYQNRNYKEAVVLFEKLLDNDPDQMVTQFYKGISNFEIAEYQDAGKSFSKVIEHDDNLYIEQAKWYLGFCYLKTEEKEKAIKQFTEIANSDSYYSEKAKKILRKLR